MRCLARQILSGVITFFKDKFAEAPDELFISG